MNLSFIKRVVERPISLPYILNLTMPNMCYYGEKKNNFDFITYAKKIASSYEWREIVFLTFYGKMNDDMLANMHTSHEYQRADHKCGMNAFNHTK